MGARLEVKGVGDIGFPFVLKMSRIQTGPWPVGSGNRVAAGRDRCDKIQPIGRELFQTSWVHCKEKWRVGQLIFESLSGIFILKMGY